jgi:PEP-CTERM motif
VKLLETINQQRQSLMKRLIRFAALVGLVAVNGAYAQVGSINSVVVSSRIFNDIPGATFSSVNGFYTSLTEAGVSKPAAGGLNRDIWQFSNNGSTAYQFQSGDYFNASFTLKLTGSLTPGVDLEAGWLLRNPSGTIGGDLQSLVTSAGVVVQFGGPSYYPFSPAAGGYPGAGGSVPNYALGQTYTMGLNYVRDPNTGRNAFQYSVNGVFAASAPGNTYFDLGPGVSLGSLGDTLGGYFQIGNDPNNPANGGTARFQEITISVVPEPATFAILGLGILSLVLRRRR